MAFDFSTLIPAGEAMAAAGLPAIGSLLSKVVPFPFSLAVEPLFNAVASALNVNPAAPDAPQQVTAAVQADPAGAVAKLQTIEDSHKAMADAANEELRIRTADVQDARATEVRYVAAGSQVAWGAPVVSSVVTLGFVSIVGIMTVHAIPESAVANVLVGTLATAFGSVVNFWLGSSAGSREKDAHLADLARAPTVQAQPGSNVHTGSVKGGR